MDRDKSNTTRIPLTIPKPLKEKIDLLAEVDNRSANNFIINILSNHIEGLEHHAQDISGINIDGDAEMLANVIRGIKQQFNKDVVTHMYNRKNKLVQDIKNKELEINQDPMI